MPKTKSYREMTEAELIKECEIWWDIMQMSRGPGSPSNDAREGAYRLYQEASAWLFRRDPPAP